MHALLSSTSHMDVDTSSFFIARMGPAGALALPVQQGATRPRTPRHNQEFVIFAKAQAYPTSLITDLVIVWSLPYLYMDILVL